MGLYFVLQGVDFLGGQKTSCLGHSSELQLNICMSKLTFKVLYNNKKVNFIIINYVEGTTRKQFFFQEAVNRELKCCVFAASCFLSRR